jgi:N-acetylmuramoyl-L-alanine amidase/putative methionine-R-sulfoxide reductase with GAF domain
MATNPSNANPVLTIKSMATSDPALQGAGASVAQSTDRREALQALLAFSTLHEQIRRRRAEEARRYAEGLGAGDNGWEFEQFVLDEVLQLVAERAQTITGADGIAIALAEGDEIICRASVGEMAPDRGVRLDAKAGFSGACFRTGRIVRCDDSEKDPRVNVEACRRLGTRSMVAVPLLGQQSVVGLLEAFSTEPFGFNDSDVRSLNLLAELILAAVKPEDQDRIVRAAKVAAAELQSAELESLRQIPMTPPPPLPVAEPGPENVPLEFSKEDIAPDLYQDSASSHRFGLVIALVAISGILLAGGLWWRFRSASHTGVAAAGGRNNSPTSTQAAALTTVVSGDNPAATALSVPAPSLPAPAEVAKTSGSSVVTGIRHWNSNGVSTIVIDLQAPVEYRKNRLPNPERIYFDLLNTSLAPGLNGQIIDVKDGLVGRIRVAQPVDNVTRVVLETKAGSTFWDNLEENPHQLVIEVRNPEAAKPEPRTKVDLSPAPTQPAPAQPEKKQAAAAPTAPPTGEEQQARARAPKLRIVIDAGHGGWDLGTVGREGLLEKNLVLEVAQSLGNLLESRLGCEVIFTRKDDNYVPLEQRAEIANGAHADLFISVHANYSSLSSARGVETYYSSFFSPPEAREIEYRENATAMAMTQAKLSGRALKDKVDESRKLAASVQRSLYGTLASQSAGIRDRGVREASFVVLTGTEMPSILAEISFVSSPTDEERLRNAAYRQQIAEALYKGIERFAATSHHVKIASSSAPSTGQ